VKASRREWEKFLNSRVWKDMRTELLLRRSHIRDMLELGYDLDKQLPLTNEDTARERGRAQELIFLSEYPDFIVNKGGYDKILADEEAQKTLEEEEENDTE
jgi:hypothetical protein